LHFYEICQNHENFQHEKFNTKFSIIFPSIEVATEIFKFLKINLNFGIFRPLKHKPPFSPTTGICINNYWITIAWCKEYKKLEVNTKNLRNCQQWFNERRNRLTASNFGKVCKIKRTTSCKNTILVDFLWITKYHFLELCSRVQLTIIQYQKHISCKE
ncbi:YqaJ domain-containing protein, partial [Aphis craccivora]